MFGIGCDFRVVARVGNGNDALRAVRELQPDILMLDLRLPGKSGLEVLRDIQGERLPTRVIVLTALEGEETVEAVALGAKGIVLKNMAVELIVRCVREVHAGRNWLERGIAGRTVERFIARGEISRRMSEVLTPRECEVAMLVAEGLPSKLVAKRLDINEGTAKLHLHNVYRKLKLRGRVALMNFIRGSPS